MNLPPLPELPEPDGIMETAEEFGGPDAYTAATVRELLLSYGRAVQEACARVCDSRADETGYGDATDFIAGEFAGARSCAAAIRNGVIREGEGE